MPAATKAPATTPAVPEGASPDVQLYAALAAFQGEVTAAPKDASNPHFRCQYATLASVLQAIQPATAHGLSHTITFETSDSGPLLVATLLHIGGASIRSTLPIGFGADWQKNGSAISYARRYALMALYGLAAADDDDDGNTAAPARVPAQRQAPTSAPARRTPEDDRAITIATARKRCREAGLTDKGFAHMVHELGEGLAVVIDQLPDHILKRLATAGASDQSIARWNAGGDLPDEQQEPLPLADQSVVAQLAGASA